MLAVIYKKIITDFSKLTIFFLAILVCFQYINQKTLILTPLQMPCCLREIQDLKYLREVNENLWF